VLCILHVISTEMHVQCKIDEFLSGILKLFYCKVVFIIKHDDMVIYIYKLHVREVMEKATLCIGIMADLLHQLT
jgi:hypothetical protein